jgi:hypothetical protein
MHNNNNNNNIYNKNNINYSVDDGKLKIVAAIK